MQRNGGFMPNVVVVGLQWGDEGKGKIVDVLAGEADAVVRFQGGDNAGHTIIVNGKKIVLHLAPSGIQHPGLLNLIGLNVVCNLAVLKKEKGDADGFGAILKVDYDARVIVPAIHQALDKAREKQAKLGTTKKGIGPAYEDFAARRGLRMRDLISKEAIEAALLQDDYFEAKRDQIARLDEQLAAELVLEDVVADLLQYSEMVKSMLADTRMLVRDLLDEGKLVLYEGAQGAGLDLYTGTYPFVTSSCTTASGVATSFGIFVERVIGIAKAYTTRVGRGPFPTKANPEDDELLRKLGGEFGATTGRPRDCGWCDWVFIRHAVRMGNVTEIMMTKADILSGFENVYAATEYLIDGKPMPKNMSLTTEVLEKVEVTLDEFPGWQEDISGITLREDLPANLLAYIEAFEKFVGVKVNLLGVGPNRRQVINMAA